MRLSRHSPAVAICAVGCLLALFASTASASRAIGIEFGRETRALITGRVAIEEPFRAISVRCRVVFTGELTRNQVEKTARDRLPEGRIIQWREARVSECSGGTLIYLTPIDEVYHAFLGTLPAITGILVIDLIAFEITSGPVRCLYRGPVGYLYAVEGGGAIRMGSYLNEAISLFRGTEGCPGSMTITGTDTIEPPMRLRLVTE